MHDKLPFPESVRRRPGMYIGDNLEPAGSLQMVMELVSNAIDQHLAGHASAIDIDVDADSVTVTDDGRGLDFDAHSSAGFDVFTELHRTGTRGGHHPHVHVWESSRGYGLAVVCALADEVVAEVRRGDHLERRRYARGIRTAAPEIVSEPASDTFTRGTRVHVRLDPTMLRVGIPVDAVFARLVDLAPLQPACRFRMNGVVIPGGTVADRCVRLAEQPLIAPPLHCAVSLHDVLVDVAAAWARAGPPSVRAFVSAQATRDGGAHVDGFYRGMRRGLRAVFGNVGAHRFRAAVDDGLIAVVHAGLYAAKWGAPTKDRLLNPEAGRAVSDAVAAALPAHLTRYPALRHAFAQRLATDDA
jgi:DNA gyrase subunit B